MSRCAHTLAVMLVCVSGFLSNHGLRRTAPFHFRQRSSAISVTTPKPTMIPKHVAIILDGNGRWAAQRGLPRVAGHIAGAGRIREVSLMMFSGELFFHSSELWRHVSSKHIAKQTLLAPTTASQHCRNAVTIFQTITTCLNCGVRRLTLFAFSTENWQRSPAVRFDGRT
jgi:undecaprenyl pyrophosphate synthase